MEIMQEIVADAFEKIGALTRIDTSKHPLCTKRTLLITLLLEGDVTLILDEEEVKSRMM